MKYILCCLVCLGLLVSSLYAADKADLDDPENAVSYSIGFQMGTDFKKNGLTINPEMVAAGMREALSGAEPRLSEQDMSKSLADLQEKIMQARQELQKEQGTKNLAEGEAFLAENGKKKGVQTLPSGLQYMVLKEGKGQSPKPADSVTVHYRGTLTNGEEFDSSYSRGQPATFTLNRVIKGWTEGLQLMKPGAKYKLFIPSRLAYGVRGMGSVIQPNSTLIFEVELISVNESTGGGKPEE